MEFTIHPGYDSAYLKIKFDGYQPIARNIGDVILAVLCYTPYSLAKGGAIYHTISYNK